MSACSASMSASIRRSASSPAASRVPLQQRPQLVVLGASGGGAGRRPSRQPAPLQRDPHVVLRDGRALHGGGEPGEVAPQGVVHDVHPGLVVRTLGGVACRGRVSCGRYDVVLVSVCFMALSSGWWWWQHDLAPTLGPDSRATWAASLRPLRCCACGCACSVRARWRSATTRQPPWTSAPASRARCWPRWPSGSAATSRPTRWCGWSGARTRRAVPTARLHSYLSGVRRVLEPGLGPREKPRVLLTSDHGYRLALGREQVDAHRFADEVRTRHRQLAPLRRPAHHRAERRLADPRGDLAAASTGSRSCSACGRARRTPTCPTSPRSSSSARSLDQLRLDAEEARVLGLLALGDHAVVVAATEQATARYPLQERVWALHALALARSGRQAEALAALRHIRSVLADELGLDPGQELRDLEQAVLVQDPALQQWLRPPVVAATVPASRPTPRRHRRRYAGRVGDRRPGVRGGRAAGRARPRRVGHAGRPPSSSASPASASRGWSTGVIGRGARARLPGGDRPVLPGRRRPQPVALEPGPARARPTGRRARRRRGASCWPATPSGDATRAPSARRSAPGRPSRTR